MRFPGWPRKRVKPVTAGRKTTRQRSGLFLCGATGLFLLAFLAGIYLFFPAEVLKQRIIHEVTERSAAEIRIGRLALAPLLTLKMSAINLLPPNAPWPIEIDELHMAPRWLTLFSGNPAMRVKAELMSGTLTSGLQKNGTFTLRAEDLDFDLPLQEPLALRITGTLAEADLAGGIDFAKETQTRLALRLNAVRILGLDLSGGGETTIDLGVITLQVNGQGRFMQINVLEASGGNLAVSGEGTLIVGQTKAASRLKLTLLIRPGADLDPNLRSLLELTGKPQADGRFPLQISGSLANPVFNLGG